MRAIVYPSAMQDNPYFEDFFFCVHTENIPPEIVDPVSHFQSYFISHINMVDSPTSRCFAATETFIVFQQGVSMVMGCLSVVHEDLDSCIVSAAVLANVPHFTVDFVLLPANQVHDNEAALS
jgi:hypothetical protein